MNFDGAYEKTENGYDLWTPHISIYKINSKKEILRNTYVRLPKNCKAKVKSGGWGFEIMICNQNNKTPLNGITYKLDNEKFNKKGTQLLICETGCNDSVPKILTYTGG